MPCEHSLKLAGGSLLSRRMVPCSDRRADHNLMVLKALMADVLGGSATYCDYEDDVGKPERQPVANTLRSSPPQEGGEQTVNQIYCRALNLVVNTYMVNSELVVYLGKLPVRWQ